MAKYKVGDRVAPRRGESAGLVFIIDHVREATKAQPFVQYRGKTQSGRYVYTKENDI